MNLLQWITDFHSKLSRSLFMLEAVVLVILIGIVDYLTGYEVSFFPFYSIPIVLVRWFVDRNSAILISVFSSFAWWYADTATGHVYSTEWLRTWDMIVRFMFFCLVMTAVSGFRRQRDANRARIEWLERSQQLEEEIISISERERESIGRDLHDDLGQFLVAIGLSADALKSNLETDLPVRATAAGRIVDQLDEAVVRVRNLARGISPVDQNELGLEMALKQLAFEASRASGISCSFICDGDVVIHDNARALHLYRIAQEALNNALKHAQPKVIVIALEAGENGGLSLRITDDGVGCNPVGPGGMGLNIMHYRARTIGGVLEILPNAPTGTVVSCTVDAEAKSKSNSNSQSS